MSKSDDLIRRSYVIKTIDDNVNGSDNRLYLKDLINVIPSAEPKTGEWIKATGMMPPEFHGHHCCSECGNFANMGAPLGNREDLSKYCPNCGAKMTKGGEE